MCPRNDGNSASTRVPAFSRDVIETIRAAG
jgi:hypothetical protein